MPLSKVRNRARMRAVRKQRTTGKTVLMPKALARKLRHLGVYSPRNGVYSPVSLDDYRDLKRQLWAKAEHVKWLASGLPKLHEEIARLRALLATMPAMEDTADKQRITQLEADLARLEGMMDSMMHEEWSR